jgi:hypothetical protein
VSDISSRRARNPAGLYDRDGKRETVASGKLLAEYEGSVLVTRRGTLNLPVEVELVLEDGSSQRVPWDGAAESLRVPYRGRTALAAAVVDPDHAILLDDDLTNNHASAPAASRPGTPRIFERAIYWAELAMQALLP